MEAYANHASSSLCAAKAEPDERAAFIRKTYAHLAGAVGLFVILEVFLLRSAFAPAMIRLIVESRYNWLTILGGFILFSWLARRLASSSASSRLQYVGLGVYIVAEAVIFVPILYFAVFYISPDVLPVAAILTGALFAGLTTVVFTTRRDFSFLGITLIIGGFMSLGAIVCSIVFGFTLGLGFSVIMVCLAGVAILFDTSNVIHHYPPDQHVAASLELFASLALMFWYVLRIVINLFQHSP